MSDAWDAMEEALSNAQSAIFGETVSFTPAGGSASDVTAVVESMPEQRVEENGGVVFLRAVRVEFKKSDVASAGPGDVVTFDSKAWDYHEELWNDSAAFEAVFVRRDSRNRSRGGREVRVR